MKKFLIAAALALMSTSAFAQSSIFNATYPLAKYQPGFREINGTQLNSMVGEVNVLTGNGLTSQIGPAPQATTFLQVVNTADGANTRAEIDAFGGIPILTWRRADGTRAAPTAVQSGDELGTFNAWGYGATSYGTTGTVRMSVFANENWSDTAHGSRMTFSATPNGSTTLTDYFTLYGAGHIAVSGTAPALTSCGTTPAIAGNDIAGEVTMGTGSPTGCVITFNTAYAAAPICSVDWQTSIASMAYTISTTAITLTQTGTSSNKVDYVCYARSGG
jgi:hypothetical protein